MERQRRGWSRGATRWLSGAEEQWSGAVAERAEEHSGGGGSGAAGVGRGGAGGVGGEKQHKGVE